MLEPISKTSKHTSLPHEMLETQVVIVHATQFPDQIELYKEMDNNVKEIIKCATEPCDANFVRQNYLYVIKTLKEHRANDAIANDPNRFKKKLLSWQIAVLMANWPIALMANWPIVLLLMANLPINAYVIKTVGGLLIVMFNVYLIMKRD